jgi:hypothetical protein
MVRQVALLAVTAGLLGACGSEPPPKPVAKPVDKKGPRCAPDAADSPEDARAKMASVQGDVRKCYQLGTGTESDVKVEVTVAETGKVRNVRVVGAAPHASARTCLEKTLRSVAFSKFCGADVTIAWTYALR